MRSTAPTLAILMIGLAFQTGAQDTVKRGEEGLRVEFYVAGRLQPLLNYRVRSFRLVGANSPELASRFKGLVAQGLDKGEYIYDLVPEKPPLDQQGDFDLAGRVTLSGRSSYWITLQMPVGTYAEGAIFTLTGRVLPSSDGGREPVWIRFQHAVDHSQVVQAKLGRTEHLKYPHRYHLQEAW
jgi:hypothetical protein